MENNDSPYIYEKPLRSGLKQRSKRLAGLSALGLVGMVGIFGGSAIANTLVSSNPATTANEADAIEIVDPLIENTDAVVDPLVSAATVEPTTDPAPLVSIPLQEAKPKPNSVKVELPAMPSQSFGNTSSATPTAGSYSGGSGAGTSATKFASHEDSDDRDEDHDSERGDDHDDNNESDND